MKATQVVVDFGEAGIGRFFALGIEGIQRFCKTLALDFKDNAIPTVSGFEVCHGRILSNQGKKIHRHKGNANPEPIPN